MRVQCVTSVLALHEKLAAKAILTEAIARVGGGKCQWRGMGANRPTEWNFGTSIPSKMGSNIPVWNSPFLLPDRTDPEALAASLQ